VDFTPTAALTFVPPVLCVASQAAHTVVMSQFNVVSQGSFVLKVVDIIGTVSETNQK